jgi:hypothetical protein
VAEAERAFLSDDRVLLDHGTAVLAVTAVQRGTIDCVVALRLFTVDGMRDFYVDADEVPSLIDVLKSAVAREAELRLHAKDEAKDA